MFIELTLLLRENGFPNSPVTRQSPVETKGGQAKQNDNSNSRPRGDNIADGGGIFQKDKNPATEK